MNYEDIECSADKTTSENEQEDEELSDAISEFSDFELTKSLNNKEDKTTVGDCHTRDNGG